VGIAMPGRYSLAGKTFPTSCPAGKYAGEAGQGECRICAAGTATARSQAGCSGCAAGRYQPEPGQPAGTCTTCALTTFSGGNAGSCTPHPSDCITRNPGFAPRAGDTSECNIEGSGICGEGLDCTGSIVRVRAGFWVSPRITMITPFTVASKCLRAAACATGSGGTSVECARGHAGLLCGVCEAGYGLAAGSCVPCPPEGASHLMSMAFAAVGCWVALTLTRKTLPMEQKGHAQHWRTWLRRKCTELFGCAVSFGLTADSVANRSEITAVATARDTSVGASKRRASALAIMRILINYMAMTSLLASFKLDWGSSLRWLFGIQKVLSGAMPPLMDCMGMDFFAQSILTLSLPAFVIGAPLLLIMAWMLPQLHIRKKIYDGGDMLPPGLTLWGVPPLQVLPNAMLMLCFLLWPSLVAALLKIVDCSVVVDGVSYVTADLTTSCDSGEYKAVAGVAIMYLMTLVPAFPLGIFVLLQRNTHNLAVESFSQRFSFLYVGYTQREYKKRFAISLRGRSLSWQFKTKLFVWWECIVMARKFLLVAVTVWFGRDPKYQIYAGTWVLLVAVLLHVVCEPYEDKMMGRLESLSLCAVLGSLLLGNAIALGGLSAASEETVRNVAALLNLGMFVVFGGMFMRSLRKLGRDMKKRRQPKRGQVEMNPLADKSKWVSEWEHVTDEATGGKYWWNATTNETQWEAPTVDSATAAPGRVRQPTVVARGRGPAASVVA
jgi:hypothetical protein